MTSGLIAIAAAIAIAVSTIGPAIGQGLTASKAMEAIARQPEAAGGAYHLRPADCVHAGRQGVTGLGRLFPEQGTASRIT